MGKIRALSVYLVFFLVLTCILDVQGQTTKATKIKAKESAPQTVTPGDAFKKMYPQFTLDSVKPSPIKGLYEVIVNNGAEIFYFDPETGYVIIGNIIGKDGKSITEERKAEMITAKAKTLPLDKAVKIGSGKHVIIEFTDPDCPYCRRASTFLAEQKDLATRYVFFFPLPMHQDAENKIKFIFCAENKAKAYEDAMTGKLDDKKYEQCKKQEAADLLKTHKDVGNNMGITGTPFFIIDGKKSVIGANIPEIESALKTSVER